MPVLLTINELALLLHSNPGALKTRLHRNPLSLPPVVKIPGDRRYFFDSNEVDRWIQSLAHSQAMQGGQSQPHKGGQ